MPVRTCISGSSPIGALTSASKERPVSIPVKSSNLCFMSARELAALIRSRQVSAREVMAAHLKQIKRVNPALNAIVAKLDDDTCLALADDADRRIARGEPVGPLHGLPIAFKDWSRPSAFRGPWGLRSTRIGCRRRIRFSSSDCGRPA